MTTPATAQCGNASCPEFGVEKDMSGMPPDWADPVWCGGCGAALPGYDGEEPAPPPDQVNNELPEPGLLRWDEIPAEVTYESRAE